MTRDRRCESFMRWLEALVWVKCLDLRPAGWSRKYRESHSASKRRVWPAFRAGCGTLVIVLATFSLFAGEPALGEPGDSCRRSADCDEGERCRRRQCVSGEDVQEEEGPRRRDTEQRGSEPRGSNVCITPVISCRLTQSGPQGLPCYCLTPYGPANGVLR